MERLHNGHPNHRIGQGRNDITLVSACLYFTPIVTRAGDDVSQTAISKWMREKGIVLEENFVFALERHIDHYKKSGVSASSIYSMLEIKHQYMAKWRTNPSTLTKGNLKYKTILRAANLFGLSEIETEELANKAGLSITHLNDLETAEVQKNEIFARHFNDIISTHNGKLKDLYDTAMVSERMFRYLRNGKHIKKEPLLAILLTLTQQIGTIQDCLKTAGFVLSKSLPNDTVIMWTIENEPNYSETSFAYHINTTLDQLGLPLLMTRAKD